MEALLAVLSAIGLLLGLLLTLGVGSVWYRRVHGYSFLLRMRKSQSKTAILPSVLEEDSDSDEERDNLFLESDATSITPSNSGGRLGVNGC